MSYPLIIAADGDYVARVNFDGSWSVRWDRVFNVIFQPPHARRVAVVAYAKLLLIARHNFVATPWDVSTSWIDKWQHFQCEVEYIDHDPDAGAVQSIVNYNGVSIAKVNYDGSWSIRWDSVADLARSPMDDYRGLALFSLCRLFMAAKDRFWTSPWVETDDLDC